MQLARGVARLEAALETALGKSEFAQRRVLYLHRNRPTDVIVSLACMAVGAVEVPIDERREPTHVEFVCSRVPGLWIDREWVNSVLAEDHGYGLEVSPAAPPSVARWHQGEAADRPALVLWTTGTLAHPKGVVLSHRNLMSNAAAKLAAVPQSVEDIRLTTLPLSHAYARTCDFGTWLLSGSTLVLSLGHRGWQTLGRHHPPTIANVVPSLAMRLLEPEYESSRARLRWLGVGGAPLSHDAFRRYQALGVTVIQGYGLTETSPVVCSATPANAMPGWVGRAVDGCEVELRAGRLFVRGPGVMIGYWQDDAATRDRVDDCGWLDTGDVAERDEATGQYRIIGRGDDILVLASGNKLHPREIEAMVEELPGVAHAMLLIHADELQLWLDLTGDAASSFVVEQVELRLASVARWMRPAKVAVFDPPLSVSANELTFKGGLRRQTILSTRMWP